MKLTSTVEEQEEQEEKNKNSAIDDPWSELRGTFGGSTSLLRVNLFGCPKLESIPDFCFLNCTSLVRVDFNENLQSIGEASFHRSPSPVDCFRWKLIYLHEKGINVTLVWYLLLVRFAKTRKFQRPDCFCGRRRLAAFEASVERKKQQQELTQFSLRSVQHFRAVLPSRVLVCRIRSRQLATMLLAAAFSKTRTSSSQKT